MPGGPFGWAGQPGALPPKPARSTVALIAQISCAVLIPLGMALPFDASMGWKTKTVWAVFATLCALVQLAPTVLGSNQPAHIGRNWMIGACGAGGVLVTWLLVVAPSVSTNAGFVMTVAAAGAAIGSACSPGRRW